MLFFSLLMGGILAAAGIATYIFAPMIGPNPIFGVRIGYAYANRETWDKTNRFGGALMALVGVATLIVGLVLQAMDFSMQAGMTALTFILLAGLTISAVGMFAYARGLAQAAPIARELAAVPFRWYYLAPTLVTFAMLVVFMFLIYPSLPVDRVPSHFNISDRPDGWQTRDQFMLTFLGMTALLSALNGFVVLVATREPLVSFSRWGNSWRLDPASGLIFLGTIFAIVNLVFLALLWNIWWFATQGVLVFSFSLILWMTIPLIGFIITLFFVLGRRE